MNKGKIINEVRKISGGIINHMDNQYEKNLEDSFYQGYDLCMIKTMNLLIDAKLKDEEVISLLQKHFDMRLSEAKNMIKTAKNRKSRNEAK